MCVICDHFKLRHIDYKYMSPVIMQRGHTQKYFDGKINYNIFEHTNA